MPLCEVEQRAPGRRGAARAGRVVRVDHDERARGRRDEAAQVIEVGHPAARRIEAVVARPRAELGEYRREQRVGRQRHQHFAALVDERRQRKLDTFRRARGDEHAIGRHRKAPGGVLGRDRLARRRDSRRGSVPIVAVAHRALDGFDQVRRVC